MEIGRPDLTSSRARLTRYLLNARRFYLVARVRGLKMSDVEEDPSLVFRKAAYLEFPFFVTKALEFALFRTYGIPSVSHILQHTKQFKKCAGKRYSRLDLLWH